MKHLIATAALAAVAAAAAPAAADTWQTTWYAAPQPTWGADFALPTNVPASLDGQTVREVVRTSVGGTRLRVSFSNRYGSAPLTIGEARVAGVGSGRVLTFGGRREVVVAPGATATSDAVDFALPPLQRLSISAWLPQRAPLTTFHWGAQQTGLFAAGNATAAEHFEGASTLQGRAFLSAVEVEGGTDGGTIVAFGDSITDGNGSTPDSNRRWPDYLADKLAPQGVGVANAGISGARLLSDRMGVKALDRFQHDVLDQPGVSAVVVLMGINDIGWPGSAFAPQDAPATAEQLIAVYRQLIARAHAKGVRVIGGTLLPYEGSLHGTPFEGHYTPAKDAVRRQVNEWIRNSGAFDAVADFDAALRDPAHPSRLLPRYDCGDHLHPSDAGYEAMADVVSGLRLRDGS
ncbi:SGNH/GDSL hydrolase family protein [Pseudoduganella sp. UC29_106]|uniref:SGNH/GDSL hydrolase family protein n=1 Tax=Pseudoduganella sp. UC29_106 TaxID=3374553 RepID=UPI0037581065